MKSLKLGMLAVGWALFPIWLGEFFYRLTGYVWQRSFDQETDKAISYRIVRMR